MRHISRACGPRRKDVFALPASSAEQAMFDSVQTVRNLSASIRALQPVDSQHESAQWQNDRCRQCAA